MNLLEILKKNADNAKSYIDGLVSKKQDTLTFDTAPTEGSQNPVTSDGIQKAIAAKTVDLSNYPTKDGTGATGNWNINITGIATRATRADFASKDSGGLIIDKNYFKIYKDNPIGTSYDDIVDEGIYDDIDTLPQNVIDGLLPYTGAIVFGKNWKHQLIFDTAGKIVHRKSINGDKFTNVGQIAYTDSNVASAAKLQTARNIALIGNATGSASFDGSEDININTTVNESKHAATADTATKATQDASGNVIEDTYATKAEVTVKGIKVDDATSPLVPDGSGVVTIPNADLSNYYTKTQVNAAITNAISAITDGDDKSY